MRSFLLKLALFGCSSGVLLSAQQLISVGVKGGLPLTDFYADESFPPVVSEWFISPTHSFNGGHGYVVGAAAELKLPLHLSIEMDGLYRPLTLSYQYGSVSGLGTSKQDFDSWEFPTLAKYHLTKVRRFDPYVGMGPSFRAVSSYNGRYLSKDGFTAEAGGDFQLLHLRFEPDIRYTY